MTTTSKRFESIQSKVDTLALKRLFILSESNENIPFSSLWETGRVVIIFIRHFACPSCKAHVNMVWQQREKFKNQRIVFIGNGQPKMIENFKWELKAKEIEIYTDPTLETFNACGLNSGLRYLINYKSLKNILEYKRQGHSKDKWNQDYGEKKQMGGIVAFKKPGLLLYHYVSQFVGDFDNPEGWPLTEFA